MDSIPSSRGDGLSVCGIPVSKRLGWLISEILPGSNPVLSDCCGPGGPEDGRVATFGLCGKRLQEEDCRP